MKWGAFYRQSKKLIFLHDRRKTTGSYTQKQWEILCSFFNGVCPRCLQPTEEFTKDHIVPLSLGGTDNINNIGVLCRRCNSQKSNLYVTDYRPEHVKEWAENETRKILEADNQ